MHSARGTRPRRSGRAGETSISCAVAGPARAIESPIRYIMKFFSGNSKVLDVNFRVIAVIAAVLYWAFAGDGGAMNTWPRRFYLVLPGHKM
jgi:hypothetical protein